MRSAKTLVASTVLATLAMASASRVWCADAPLAHATMLDTVSPTAPRGLAADLPRSPLSDAIVNRGQRFSTSLEARRHCPRDDVVRVEVFSNLYGPATTPGSGAFMCKAAALQEGDRPRDHYILYTPRALR